MSFKNFSLRAELLKSLDTLNFHEPTPIQQQAIAPALEGKDVLASAQTGTGKTLAFLLPVIHRMLEQGGAEATGGHHHTQHRPVSALVLLPTRELAAQVAGVAKDVGRFTTVKTALLVGGESFHQQLSALRSGASLVIATPGRLLDHLERRTIRLDKVHTLVLDEADRMLDMGFAPALHAILGYIPTQRQTMLFSATLPQQIEKLTHLALKHPTVIRMAVHGSTAASVNQLLYPVMARQKNDLLLAILRSTPIQSVLIFSRTRFGADRLERFLRTNDFAVIAMHSDRTQSQRTAALHGFKTGRFQIMVATDIAARGIDVKKLSHVINFDVPEHTEDYVHRIGRTGRALEVGEALTISTPDDERYISAIQRFIGRTLPRVQIPDFPYDPLPLPQKPKSMMQRFGSRRRSIPRRRR